MGTTAQKLQAIQNSKAAIKSAIEAKGVSDVGDVLSTYATKIADIPTGGGSKYGLTMDNIFGDVNAQGALQFPSVSGAFSSSDIVSIPEYGMYYKFYKSTGISSVNLPNLTRIAFGSFDHAFYDCDTLTSVSMPKLGEIGGDYTTREAFRDCNNLTTVDLSGLTGFTYYGTAQDMFYACRSLKTVYLNHWSSGTATGSNGLFRYCSGLETIDCSQATSVPPINSDTFSNTNNTFKVIVPNALYNSWKSASNWSGITGKIVKANPGLQFNATTANSTVKLEAVGSPTPINLKYSVNTGTFSTYTIGDTITLTNVGDNVIFIADENGNATLSEDTSNYYQFVMTGSMSCEETVNYLLNEDGEDSSSQSNAYCFYKLFSGCSALTNAPQLPISTNDVGCYAYMFEDCTGIETTPELPYTTLYANCYEGMFKGCTSITEAPTLPATTLATGCYNEMFYGCSSLDTISLGYTGNFSTTYFNDWVYGVAASGTFLYFGNDTTRGTSAIPSGWTIPTYEYGGLTFTSRQDNSTVKMVADSGAPSVSLQYTKTGVSWTNYTLGDTITVNAGENLGFKATTTNGAFSTTYNLKSNYFVTTGQFDLSGNINSLLNENYESVTSIPNSCWGYLFKDNTSIIDASNLKFPATTVDNFGYGWMFSGCSNMTKGPEIFATSIGSQYGIDHFFYNCSSLTEIKIHYTGSFGGNRFSSWVDGVQTTGGTFYYNGSDTTTGVSAIPVNWTVTPFVTYKNYINTNIAEMNTGVVPTTTTKVVGRFRGSAVGNWFVGIEGQGWRCFNSTNTFYVDVNGMSARINQSGWDTTKWYDVEFGNFYFTCTPVDGGTTLSQTSTARSFTHSNPLKLGSATYNWQGEYEKFDCAGFKIYDGTTLVKDYRPAVDGNGVACFREEVSGTLAYPSSGTFLAY